MVLKDKLSDLAQETMRTFEKIKEGGKKVKKEGEKFYNVTVRQNKIEKTEKMLGRKCYELIKSGTLDIKEKNVIDYVEEINRLKAEIKKIGESEIVCGSCGHTSDMPIKFCPSCGKKI